MGKPAPAWISLQKRNLLLLLAVLSISTAAVLFLRGTLDCCNCSPDFVASSSVDRARIPSPYSTVKKNPLGFMRSKLVLLVSHELSISGAMIDSHTTAEYWKNRTHERLGIHMPKTYVVHLGNSKEVMEVAKDSVARRVLREHIRESLGIRNEDLLFAIINSVSRGKGQDLFLQSFYESLRMIREQKLQVPIIHAVVVGSDMYAQTKFEMELRNFVGNQGIKDRVHFVNKTLTVAPYLAAIDVLVQNSQARGECFGRITIEAMAFQLPVLGSAAGGTTEIVVDGSTGLLHPSGKEGVSYLAKNIVKLATHVERRLTMGKKGYARVKERFMEHHMAERIASVLKEVLQKSKSRLA